MMSRALLILAAMAAAPAFAADVVAERTLRVGTVLESTDLRAADPEAEDAVADMVGLEVRRAIYAGHPVEQADLGPPTLVHRNDVVMMTYRSGALGLRAEGRALGAGGAGEPIEVMNLDSRTTVRGIVVGPRQVEVRR